MNQNTTFSVIIPTYNRADLIKNAINSVLGQNYHYFEVIVVDNCSTDNTQETLQPLVDQGKIRFIKNEKNYGRSYSRNTGIKNSTGDWILLLDSDDLLKPNALEHLCTEASRNKNANLVAGAMEFIDGNGNPLPEIRNKSAQTKMEGFLFPNFIREMNLPMGSYTVRRSYLEDVGGFDPSMEPCEDYDFWLRLLASTEIVLTGVPILQVRRHDLNTTPDSIHQKTITVSHRHYAKLSENSALTGNQKKKAASDFFLNIADSHYYMHQYSQAVNFYIQSISKYPPTALNSIVYRRIAASIIKGIRK